MTCTPHTLLGTSDSSRKSSCSPPATVPAHALPAAARPSRSAQLRSAPSLFAESIRQVPVAIEARVLAWQGSGLVKLGRRLVEAKTAS